MRKIELNYWQIYFSKFKKKCFFFLFLKVKRFGLLPASKLPIPRGMRERERSASCLHFWYSSICCVVINAHKACAHTRQAHTSTLTSSCAHKAAPHNTRWRHVRTRDRNVLLKQAWHRASDAYNIQSRAIHVITCPCTRPPKMLPREERKVHHVARN